MSKTPTPDGITNRPTRKVSKMSATTTASSAELNLVGRLAVVEQQISIITRINEDQVFTMEHSAPCKREAVTVLPMLGEFITATTTAGLEVSGYWLGLNGEIADVRNPHFNVPVVLVVAGSVRQFYLSTKTVDASLTVKSKAEPGEHLLMITLYELHKRHAMNQRAHDRWTEKLISDAHEYADDNSLCHVFDEFMEEHGLRGRERDHDIEIEVTARITIEAPGTSESNAFDNIDAAMVLNNLSESDLNWELA